MQCLLVELLTHLALLVFDHDVVRLDIAMHDTLGMAEIQGL